MFKSRTDVMKHRLSDHTEEVPMCNSIAEKKKCAKKRKEQINSGGVSDLHDD